MKLSDINETVFQALTPEVQTQLIAADKADPLVAIAFIVMIIVLPFAIR